MRGKINAVSHSLFSKHVNSGCISCASEKLKWKWYTERWEMQMLFAIFLFLQFPRGYALWMRTKSYCCRLDTWYLQSNSSANTSSYIHTFAHAYFKCCIWICLMRVGKRGGAKDTVMISCLTNTHRHMYTSLVWLAPVLQGKEVPMLPWWLRWKEVACFWLTGLFCVRA